MSRIAIDDLPALEALTAEQMAALFGRGLAKTRLYAPMREVAVR